MTIVAVDFGGRRIKLGIVTAGRVTHNMTLPALADQPLERRLPVVADALRTLCQQAGTAIGDCRGIGISYPSIIDPVSHRILDQFGKFEDGSRLELADWAQTELGLPLAIDNDARMALIGEWQYGAGRGHDDVAVITLGTGLGTAAVIGGKPLRGRHGQAGILGGHWTVRDDGAACVCGNVGCAEAEASTARLATHAHQLPAFANSPLADEAELSYKSVFRWADAGDPCARQLTERALRVWGILAVNLIHAYDPELIILTGGVMGSAERILPAVREWVRQHAHTPWGQVRVEASELGDHAALLAAEWLIQEQRGKGNAR